MRIRERGMKALTVALAMTFMLVGCTEKGKSATASSDERPTSTTTTTTTTTTAPPTTAPPTTVVTHDIRGELLLRGNRNASHPENCRGFDDYKQQDIQVGAQVVVKDGSGNIVGVGSLVNCRFIVESGDQARGIRFDVRVDSVAKADFYTVEAAGAEPQSYSYSQLEQNGWVVSLVAKCDDSGYQFTCAQAGTPG